MKLLPLENLVSAADMNCVVKDMGLMDYEKSHEFQLQCVSQQLSAEIDHETILLTEHPSVFTLGRKGTLTSLLKSRSEITAEGVKIIHTERGGDITYHGPGQLVVYPIINLRKRGLSVTEYVHLLEDLMLKTALDFGVTADRDSRNRGIWVGNSKIGSVGIRVRHGITFHGLSFNVNLSLTPFQWVQPCGLAGVGVTSLEKELGAPVSIEAVKDCMKLHITELLCRSRGQ